MQASYVILVYVDGCKSQADLVPAGGYRRVRKICEKRILASSCLSVRPSVRMDQLGSHWTDIHENLYLRIFGKYIEKIQVFIKIGQE